MAEPSARNSGLDKTANEFLPPSLEDDFCAASSIDLITSAVLTGNVLFSTTTVNPLANFATCLTSFYPFKVTCFASANPFFFSGRVNGYKNHISILYFFSISFEK